MTRRKGDITPEEKSEVIRRILLEAGINPHGVNDEPPVPVPVRWIFLPVKPKSEVK